MHGYGLYFVFLIPPLVLGFLVQGWLKKTVGQQMQVPVLNGLSGAEAVTNYAVPVTNVTWTMPGGSQQTGTFTQIQTPDGVYQNVYSHSSGWDEGMPVLVNTYDSQVALQRQAVTSYAQDNTSVGYVLNPRVTETNIY